MLYDNQAHKNYNTQSLSHTHTPQCTLTTKYSTHIQQQFRRHLFYHSQRLIIKTLKMMNDTLFRMYWRYTAFTLTTKVQIDESTPIIIYVGIPTPWFDDTIHLCRNLNTSHNASLTLQQSPTLITKYSSGQGSTQRVFFAHTREPVKEDPTLEACTSIYVNFVSSKIEVCERMHICRQMSGRKWFVWYRCIG